MLRSVLAAACAGLGLLAAAPASAQCSFQVLPIPVTIVGTRPAITVKVGGREARFLIDSGSAVNLVSYELLASRNLLKRQGIKPVFSGYLEMTGANGTKFTVPRLALPDIEFLGTTFHNVVFYASNHLEGMDGLVGQPMLRRMDVEYDLKNHVIRLVKTQDCKTADMVYWVKPGQTYTKMPMAWEDRDQPGIFGDIFINGKKLRAQFDTGSSTSFITESAAAKVGVKTADPGVVPIGKTSGLDTAFDSWVATFADMKIGDEEIKDAPLVIGQSTAHDFDVLIGADFFLSHHVYVSHIQNQIYFVYEGGPVFQAERRVAATQTVPATTQTVPATRSAETKTPVPAR